MMTTATVTPMTGEQWRSANFRYLEAEMAWLRLLLHRRVLWLRKHWRRDSAQNYLGWAISDHEADLLLAGKDRQEELNFYKSDPEAQEISARLEEAVLRIAAQRREMEEAGSLASIDILAARFGLTAFEREMMLLCLAPELDPTFERLYAYVHDDATRKYATPYLALTLLADAEAVGIERASMLPEAPLRRWRLLAMETAGSGATLSGCALRIDERMMDYLLGINRLDQRCHSVLRGAPGVPLPSCHRDLATQLAQWLQAGSGRNRLKLINLVGEPDSGRLAVAQAVCAQTRLSLLVLDPGIFHASSLERREIVALLEREAVLLGLAFYADLDSLKPEQMHSLRSELERFAAPMMIASRERFQCDYETLAVHVARPDVSSQTELWKQVLGDSASSLNGDVEAIVQQYDFGPRAIVRTVALAENRAAMRLPGEKAVSSEDLWQACRQQSAPQLEQLAQKVTPCYDWDDIVVPAEVLCQLREITAQVAHRHFVYQGWGFGKKLSRGRGISALFAGASGVGKTMAAEVMARHLKLDLYRIDLAGVVSKYIGETEKNLRSVFDAAERSGAILFFDEADALFGKRSEVKDSHDRYANIEVNYLLQRMEDYRGLAILATNMKAFLDSAFMRRLRFIVDFPFPDAVQRKEIWRRVFPPTAAVRGLDLGVLSRLEITGGNIRNIAVNAAFLAADEGAPIGMEHVMRAARREYTKIDRLVMDAEFGCYVGAGAQ
ncbi:MAG TPA: ATP-binding protein [Terriglobales bacterium]|nr:ATP-binding protein [Terriglobales bacterium]